MAREIDNAEDGVPVEPAEGFDSSRRRFLSILASATLTLPFISCEGQNEPLPANPDPTPVSPERLTAETRREMTLYIKDIEDALNRILNPTLGGRFDLSYVTQARDKELIEWWQSHLIRKTDDRIDLRLKVKHNDDETEFLPVFLTMVLGQRWGNIFPHQIHLSTSLVKAARFYPQLEKFLDANGKAIPLESLKEAGQAYFLLPTDIAWENFYEGPSLQNINGIHGKSSSNDLFTPLVDIRIYTNSLAQLFYYPPLYTPLNFPLSK